MNRTQKMVIGGVAAVLVVSAIVGTFMYGLYTAHWESSWFRAVAGSFPVARVDNRSVKYNDYLMLADSGRKYLQSPAAQADGLSGDLTTAMKQAAYERAIRINMVGGWSQEEGITVSSSDVDKAFDAFIMQSDASSTREQAVAELKQYFGWGEDEFKSQVMRPALLEDLLAKKYEDQGKTQADFDALVNDHLGPSHVKRYFKF